MDSREAIAILEQHMKKFTRYPRYKQAVDVAIEAIQRQLDSQNKEQNNDKTWNKTVAKNGTNH